MNRNVGHGKKSHFVSSLQLLQLCNTVGLPFTRVDVREYRQMVYRDRKQVMQTLLYVRATAARGLFVEIVVDQALLLPMRDSERLAHLAGDLLSGARQKGLKP